MPDIKVRVDMRKLNNVIKALTATNNLVIRVGILSNKNARDDGKESNASIGVVHEFGSFKRKIPPRSFIRMPLQKRAGGLVRRAQEIIAENLVAGNPMPILKLIGVEAEGAIGDAFKSGGFGAWKAIKPATAAAKGSTKILIESSQLQRSITSKVVKRGS
jgi:hypothetical protein